MPSQEFQTSQPIQAHRDELQERLQTAEQKASYLEDQLHLAQAEIIRMRGTISWRITGPIRVFRNIVFEPLLRLLKTSREAD